MKSQKLPIFFQYSRETLIDLTITKIHLKKRVKRYLWKNKRIEGAGPYLYRPDAYRLLLRWSTPGGMEKRKLAGLDKWVWLWRKDNIGWLKKRFKDQVTFTNRQCMRPREKCMVVRPLNYDWEERGKKWFRI